MIYTYVCPQGHEVDARGGVADVSRPCECGKTAKRREFNLAAIVGTTVPKEQRQDVRNFREASEEVDYHYTSAERKGMPVKRPDLWSEAKRRAAKRDPERFIDRAQEIDYAYSRADQEVGAKIPRPRDYKAGLVRARAMALERGDTKLAATATELDKRAVSKEA